MGGGGARIKGTAMLHAIRALRSMGKDRARHVLPKRLHEYLDGTRVLASSWYPEEDMLDVNRALAQVMQAAAPNRSVEETYVEMGRLVGRIDLAGLYSALLASERADMIR